MHEKAKCPDLAVFRFIHTFSKYPDPERGMEYLMQVYYHFGAPNLGGVVKGVHLLNSDKCTHIRTLSFEKKLSCTSTVKFRRGVPKVVTVHFRYSIACYGKYTLLCQCIGT